MRQNSQLHLQSWLSGQRTDGQANPAGAGASSHRLGQERRLAAVLRRAQGHVLAATDFLTHELLTPHGLVREHVLFFENVTSREVWCGGIAHNPNGNWMAQVARNQTDAIDGKLNGMK